MTVTPEEVDVLLREGIKIAPSLAYTRILRAYAGVRPLIASDDDPSGRSISRGIVCLDHAVRDGIEGFVTISGGKLMTYRLMAEWAADMVCKKLGIEGKKCMTAEIPLPGSDSADSKDAHSRKHHIIDMSTDQRAAEGRHGSLSSEIPTGDVDDALVCECEAVSVGEVNFAIDKLNVNNLINLRRRTRMGMGTCQGGLCACRAAAILGDAGFTTEIARNGQIAVDMLKKSVPGYYQLVLMDVQMPVMDGYEATKTIRNLKSKEHASIPILAMTANAFEEDKQQAIECGMNGHLAKPIDVEVLLATLDRILS